MENTFGSPTFGNASTPRYKFFKMLQPEGEEQTSVVHRIMPPVKSLAAKGHWSCFHGNHFGYSGVNSKDPTKTRMRPFGCIFKDDYKTKMVLQACPACEEYDRKDAELETKSKLLEENPENTKLQAEVTGLKGWVKSHNNDRKHHINVMSLAGELGVLTISNTVKKMLDKKMEELRNPKPNARGVTPAVRQPISTGESVYFNFTRMGQFPVQDNVEVYKEEDETGASRIVTAPALTPEQIAQALETLPDLKTEVVRYISPAQIAAIVAAKGDPELVDAAWGTNNSLKNAPDTKTVVAPLSTPVVETPVKTPEPPVEVASSSVNEEFFAKFRAKTNTKQP